MPTPEPIELETLATPEGDNEALPDEPLQPASTDPQTPRGSKPDNYRQS